MDEGSAKRSPALRTVLRALVVATALSGTGCGYMLGSPYQRDIRTVSVPIFTSASFRRDLEFQLTEMVQKEIQARTPFRIVPEPYADTRLTGHIVDVHKHVLGWTAFDDPRQLQISYAVVVTWEDLRTGALLQQQVVPIPPESLDFVAEASFAPEVGQSLATANHTALGRLARDIVNRMEAPW